MEFEKIMTALRNAHAAGDTSAAQRLAQMAQAARQQQPQAAPQDAMVPSGDTDTRSTREFAGGGEQPLIDTSMIGQPRDAQAYRGRTMDFLQSGLSGLARGATELAALPATIGDGLGALYERTGLIPQGSRENEPSIGAAIRDVAAQLTSGGIEYEPQTTPAEYAQTIGEFIGGGAGGRAGVLGGLLSEGAGQAAEGTAAEPYARAVFGIAGGLAGQRPTSATSMTMGEAADDANALMQRGITPTAAQVSDSGLLARLEGTVAPTGQQLDDLTAAALQTVGMTGANRATPKVLSQASDNITNGMNNILRNVDVPIDTSVGQRVLSIMDDYTGSTAGGAPTVSARRIANEIMDAATSPSARTFPATQMREWRTRLGKLTTSSDEATRDFAHELREVIDDATEAQLSALGRVDDISELSTLRNQYRNFLVLADASTKGGREGARGILTPERLSTASQRTVGRTNYALGRGTDLSDLSLQAMRVLGSQPTVSAGGFRDIVGLGSLGLGGSVGLATQSVPLAIGAAAAPIVGQSVMRSAPVQSLLMNPRAASLNAMRTTPGLLAQ
jgi:hypothetical protein